MSPAPGGVLLVHGTRDPRGRACAGALVQQLRLERPDARFRLAFLDVQPPRAPRTGAEGDVVVPLLLSAGTHALSDAPALAAAGLRPTRYVGPDPRLAALAVRRLRAAGDPAGHTVVLVGAGSRHPLAPADLRRAADLVATQLDTEVAVATVAGGGLAESVRRTRAETGRPVALLSWLLAPGLFADAVRDSGADLVGPPLGVSPEVVDVVLDRYDELAYPQTPIALNPPST